MIKLWSLKNIKHANRTLRLHFKRTDAWIFFINLTIFVCPDKPRHLISISPIYGEDAATVSNHSRLRATQTPDIVSHVSIHSVDNQTDSYRNQPWSHSFWAHRWTIPCTTSEPMSSSCHHLCPSRTATPALYSTTVTLSRSDVDVLFIRGRRK